MTFRRIALEGLGTPDKTAAIQDHAQGHQRAVAALFLRASTHGLGIGHRRAFEIGVGQIVQGHGGLETQ